LPERALGQTGALLAVGAVQIGPSPPFLLLLALPGSPLAHQKATVGLDERHVQVPGQVGGDGVQRPRGARGVEREGVWLSQMHPVCTGFDNDSGHLCGE